MKKGGKRARPGGILLVLTAFFAAVMCWGTMTVKSGPEAAVACLAEERAVIPVGRAVGMKLFSRGVLVVGLSQVETEAGVVMPAQSCGLKTGDIITQINRENVNDIDAVSQLIRDSGGETLSFQVQRGGKTLNLSGEAAACMADGSYKLGAWLRDSMAGIGTVTWYDPESATFAALGHGISDVDTGLLMPLRSGSILPATITGVEQGESGSPGQLHGTFDLSGELGSLTVNSDVGVFGQAAEGWTGEPVPIARRSEVGVGEAQILANVEGDEVAAFQVEIQRIYPQGLSQGRDLMIRVTDPALLEKTGGIVPGMSGCPILQNGRLVGAVTHVLIQDPTRGYGILAETMAELTD